MNNQTKFDSVKSFFTPKRIKVCLVAMACIAGALTFVLVPILALGDSSSPGTGHGGSEPGLEITDPFFFRHDTIQLVIGEDKLIQMTLVQNPLAIVEAYAFVSEAGSRRRVDYIEIRNVYPLVVRAIKPIPDNIEVRVVLRANRFGGGFWEPWFQVTTDNTNGCDDEDPYEPDPVEYCPTCGQPLPSR